MNEQLLADIDAAIKTNGNGAITGPILNNLLKRIVNAGSGSPSAATEFPAHTSLTAGDIGKLVMNVNGQARVSNRIPQVLGQVGKWTVIPAFPTQPEQATITILLPNTYTPNDGDMFYINSNNIFYFRTTATTSNEITISGTHSVLASNMADALSSSLSFILVSNNAVSGGTEFKLSVNYSDGTIGYNSNNFFSFSTSTPINQTGSTYGADNDYPAENHTIVLTNVSGSSNQVRLYDVLTQVPDNGNMIVGQYWPLNRAEYMQAFLDEMNNRLGYYFTSAIEQYGPGSSDTHIVITELEVPKRYGSTVEVSNLSQTSSTITQLIASRETVPAYVPYPILGVLTSVADGVAKIANGGTMKLKLSTESEAVTFDEDFPAALYNRFLVGHDNGEVTTVKDDNEDSTGKYLIPAGVFQALTEAEPGGYVLVREFSIMGGQ